MHVFGPGRIPIVSSKVHAPSTTLCFIPELRLARHCIVLSPIDSKTLCRGRCICRRKSCERARQQGDEAICLVALWLGMIVPAYALSLPIICRRYREAQAARSRVVGSCPGRWGVPTYDRSFFSMMMALENAESVCRGVHEKYVIRVCWA